MSWRTSMSGKEELIFDVNDGMAVAEAAERHGVARSCAYKWVTRYRQFGVEGLQELSRRPECSPKATPQKLTKELLKLKAKYPDFGPAKLVALLETKHGEPVLAASTAGKILDEHGQVKKRRSRQPSAGRIEHPSFQIGGAGDSMSADFKGQFRMGNGRLCYPLTVADPFSRFVLGIEAMASTHMEPVKKAFERLFHKYGVPRQIITDNGTPFCSAISLGGLTQLSRWWIEIGSTPVRIAPGRPDQNGRHERTHRTFKQWISRHPKKDLSEHQKSFAAFRDEFNKIRPHQALGQKQPQTMFQPYTGSTKRKAIEYDSVMDVRKVNTNGEIKWRGERLYVSEVLIGANIGLLPVGEQLWSIHLGHVKLGYLDCLALRVVNRKPSEEQ